MSVENKDFVAADLTGCDAEPIHALGRVQSFGYLIAVNFDLIISFASTNLPEVLARDASALVGRPLADVIAPETIEAIRGALMVLGSDTHVEQVSDLTVHADLPPQLLHMHRSGDYIILEFEPAPAPDATGSEILDLRTATRLLGDIGDEDRLFQHATARLKAMSGFDRVMVYRFHADGSGEVVGEAIEPDMEPYLHLRYPASDIPVQARALYLRNPIRLIADATDEGARIVPDTNPHGAPLDLSQSTLRAVSPIHLEYLRNMGVAASMSVSLIVRGRLWGLIACHHRTPYVLHPRNRSAAELFGNLLSFKIERDGQSRETALDARVSQRLKALASFSSGTSARDALLTTVRDLRDIIPYDGFAVAIEGNLQIEGAAPPRDSFDELIRLLNQTAAAEPYAVDRLSQVWPRAAGFAGEAAGLLALPVSKSPRDYVILFRREIVRSIQWAGNPSKAVGASEGGRLNPRRSFEAWRELVQGRSEPWSEQDMRTAGILRNAIIELVLRQTDQADQERRRAIERQEVLVAELNHRVRNILSLVKGIVGQSTNDELSLPDYRAVIESRLQALARAHDQITQVDWSPASLAGMIRAETEGYLMDDPGRIAVEGRDVMLKPTAFSTMALVIHELVTNAAKYGALSRPGGRVRILTEVGADGGLSLGWIEQGGPAVVAPSRRGFGSTVIERSIPFDLGGTADVEYAAEGLRARLSVPAAFVEPGEVDAAPVAPPPSRVAETQPFAAPGDVLLVEDNMVIALDAEDILTDMGARVVRAASSVASALSEIADALPDFAVLDVNLGSEDSIEVATALMEAGVAFIFTTGYGDRTNLPESLRGVPVVPKPYQLDTLREAMRKALAGT